MCNNYTPVIGEIETKNGKNIWKIEKYSTIETEQSHFYSPVFTTSTPIPNSPLLRWQLKVQPNVNKQDKSYISVYVFYLGDLEVTGFLSISLLSDTHERLLKRRFKNVFDSCNRGYGFDEFTHRNSLTRKKQPFLIADTLRMTCSFTFVNSTFSEESSKQMEHYKNLFDSGSYSDVTFVIGQHKLKLHKAILTGFSPVFQAMFEHDMKENKESVVTIKDIKFDTMKEMFRYIYLRQVENIQKNSVNLLIAADKYSVTGLKTLCELTVSASLKLDNAIIFLRLSILLNALYVKSKATDFILNHLKDFIEREDFKKMDSSCNYELFKAIVQKGANK